MKFIFIHAQEKNRKGERREMKERREKKERRKRKGKRKRERKRKKKIVSVIERAISRDCEKVIKRERSRKRE